MQIRWIVVLDSGATQVFFTAVNIREFVVRASRLHELVELGTLTSQAAEFLDACVVAGLDIVVAGGTQAGSKRGCPAESGWDVWLALPDVRAAC